MFFLLCLVIAAQFPSSTHNYFYLRSCTIYYSLHSIGIHQRPGDLEVNICKTKALNNMRAAGKDNNAGVIAPVEMSLDSCVEYIASDEILEITPSLFRMSKNPDFAKKGKGGRGN